ncbi:DUF2169 family type VI secretion system accessory protein [Paraburkholderia flagellata]|uniref:DUF2169 family type VI secretion system accessory protein n=1 Tax=Paraburkholderia flagellata TaxID=2883241 RepID=UPI001F319778|nr:DUF2169 domain-containing protein [Paraburkholderia flagellata]
MKFCLADMWEIDNRTQYAADRGWVRDREGREIWLVAVKATFDILADGSSMVSKEQPPVLRVPCYHGEPGKSSIKYDTDLVLTKKTTDVLVIGNAWAPGGKAVTELDAGFRVGPVTKILHISGDRVWTRFGASKPSPFVKMPLVYERAFGGVDLRSEQAERDWDWRNPVGTGFCISHANSIGRPLPNFEYPAMLMQSGNDRPTPAGFGPICSHWQPRAGFGGTYDEHWARKRKPLLPEDFDDRYFQCAPIDQQSPQFLRGGETVVIENLSPRGTLRFGLPILHIGFETRFDDGTSEVHKTRALHTVILEPDYPRVSIVWHSALPCHFKVQKLVRTRVTQKVNVSKSGRNLDIISAKEA